jgi:4-hydroxy-2-oxoheptanedioate aldolase
VVVPLVNTAGEAEAAVRAMRYPPKGERSWGPIRGALYGGPDYFAQAERELVLVPMIETAQGIQNVREILAVDGVHGCLIGTNDFSLSFGLSPRPVPDPAPMDPRVEEAVQRVLEAARAEGKAAGIFTTDAEMARERIRQGFRIISLRGDVVSLRLACQEMLRQARAGLETNP